MCADGNIGSLAQVNSCLYQELLLIIVYKQWIQQLAIQIINDENLLIMMDIHLELKIN